MTATQKHLILVSTTVQNLSHKYWIRGNTDIGNQLSADASTPTEITIETTLPDTQKYHIFENGLKANGGREHKIICLPKLSSDVDKNNEVLSGVAASLKKQEEKNISCLVLWMDGTRFKRVDHDLVMKMRSYIRWLGSDFHSWGEKLVVVFAYAKESELKSYCEKNFESLMQTCLEQELSGRVYTIDCFFQFVDCFFKQFK